MKRPRFEVTRSREDDNVAERPPSWKELLSLYTLIEYRDHACFSCINIYCGSRKLFEPEAAAAMPRVQTTSEWQG